MEPKRNLEDLFSSYVESLKQSTAPAIREFVSKAEKSIPKSLHPLYKDVVRDIMTVYLVGYTLKQEYAIKVLSILKSKNIALSAWAKSVALMGYIIPLYAAQKENKKNTERSVRDSINQLHTFALSLRQVERSPQVSESVLVEGFLKSVLTKVKNAFVSSMKKLGLAIVDVASSIVSIYNDIFSLITLPAQKIASRIPGGQLLLQKVDPRWLTLLSGSPVLTGVISLHTALTSPIVKQSATVVRELRSGELFKKIDNLVNEFMREVPEDEWKQIDELLSDDETQS